MSILEKFDDWTTEQNDKANEKNEYLAKPYWSVKDNGKIHLDYDSMRDEFNSWIDILYKKIDEINNSVEKK
jgi:hypothetical protein